MNTWTNVILNVNDTITINWDDVNWQDTNMNSGVFSSNYQVSIDDILDIPWEEDLKLTQEWKEINEAAKTNPALQKALERVRILYYLSKK